MRVGCTCSSSATVRALVLYASGSRFESWGEHLFVSLAEWLCTWLKPRRWRFNSSGTHLYCGFSPGGLTGLIRQPDGFNSHIRYLILVWCKGCTVGFYPPRAGSIPVASTYMAMLDHGGPGGCNPLASGHREFDSLRCYLTALDAVLCT